MPCFSTFVFAFQSSKLDVFNGTSYYLRLYTYSNFTKKGAELSLLYQNFLFKLIQYFSVCNPNPCIMCTLILKTQFTEKKCCHSPLQIIFSNNTEQ